MSDLTFQSQQFAAQQAAQGSAYKLRGAEALGGAIGAAPSQFLAGQRATMQRMQDESALATEELRRQELGQKIATVTQLQALGMQKLQHEAASLDVTAKRIAVQQAQQALNPNYMTTRDWMRDMVSAHGIPIIDANDQVIGSPDEKGLVTRRPATDEDRRLVAAAHGSQADPKRIALDAEKAIIQLDKPLPLGAAPRTPDEEIQRAEQRARLEEMVGKRPPAKKPQAAAEDSFGTPEEVWSRIPVRPDVLAVPAPLQQGLVRALITATREYGKSHSVPRAVAGPDVVAWMQDPKHPEVLAKILRQSGFNEQQAIVHVRKVLGLPFDAASEAVTEAYR